jgi:hypothetical protein
MIFSGNMMFLYDQVREMILVRDMVLEHKPTLISTRSGIGGVFHGPLWLYTLIPFFILGGGNPFTFAFAYILLTLLTILVGFWLFTKLYNAEIGLLMAFFLTITPRIWENVKAAHGLMVIPLIYIIIFYFLTLFLRGNKKMFIFATFFAGLTLQFETASSILLLALLPIVYIGEIIFSFNKKQNLSREIKMQSKIIILSIGAFILSIANFILFDMRHNFLMGKALFHYLTNQGGHAKGYLHFPERLQQHMEALRDVYTSLIPINTTVVTLLLMVMILLAAITILQKKGIPKETKKEWIFFGVFPVCMFILYMFYPLPVYPEYVLGLIIPAAGFTALSMAIIIKSKIGKILVSTFICINIVWICLSIFDQYTKPLTPNITAGSYKNQLAVVDWIFKDASTNNFGYFVYSPDTFTYGMDYLFWWKGSKQYKYLPESKKHTQTYLVLYPSLENDHGAHTYWKENVIHVQGNIIKRKEFTGGIIVEKYRPGKNEPNEEANYHQDLLFR